ncbi:ATP-binding protein [Sporosarcina sp. ANT_H38]|uniref:ATP-binding protein n=1 Tax=Sporosarcina sp. ANT_H38 TaxID=2597358 RepID=UPI00165E6194|nr:ATP-binding protein [Sporosarcina sp. ANT_H38]
MLEPISKVIQDMMKDNPVLAKRMNDVRESLASNPIEILTTPSDDCPYQKCDGKGWLWIKDWSRQNKKDEIDEDGKLIRAEWWEHCKCYEQLIKQREIDKKLDLSGIPPIFSNATVHSYDVGKYKTQDNRDTATIAKKAAAKFIENYPAMKEHGKGLYLYSEIKGSGKTRLASSIANALVKMYDVDIAFLKANDLLSQIKKTFNNDSDTTESEIVRMFREVEVLIVDDLAVEKPTDFAERIFYDITDYRLEHKKTTLFTSNKTIENLGDIYKDGRLKSRVKKMSIEIYMPEESIRDQEAESENAELEGLLFG